MFSVSPLELVWIVLNLTTFAMTVTALFDARADRTAVKLLNGHARELAADGIIRREVIRLTTQGLLLSLVLPGLFSDRPTTLSWGVVALMAIAIGLGIQTYLDARERKALTALVAADVLIDRDTGFAKLERLVTDGIHISEQAYEAANHVKERFDAVNERITAGQDLADERHAATEQTIDTTAEEVHELHEGTAPEKAS